MRSSQFPHCIARRVWRDMTRSDVLDFIGRFKEEDNLHPAHRFYQITSSAAVSTRNKLATLQHGSAGRHFVGRGGFSRNFSLQLGVASNFRRSLTSRVAKQNPVPGMNLMLPHLAWFFTEWKMWRAVDIACVAKLFSWLTILTVWRWIFVKSKLQSWGSIAFGVTPYHFFFICGRLGTFLTA